jgi:hypothetical protein
MGNLDELSCGCEAAHVDTEQRAAELQAWSGVTGRRCVRRRTRRRMGNLDELSCGCEAAHVDTEQ